MINVSKLLWEEIYEVIIVRMYGLWISKMWR